MVAHIAANADALGNLLRWVGPTPMYTSPAAAPPGSTMAAGCPPVN